MGKLDTFLQISLINANNIKIRIYLNNKNWIQIKTDSDHEKEVTLPVFACSSTYLKNHL